MSMTLSSILTAVWTVSRNFWWSKPRSVVCAATFTDPKLQTAVSSLEVFKRISVHKLELCTTPTWSCGERTFDGSFQVIQGCPVSKSMLKVLRHNCTAETVLYWRIL